MKIVDRIKNILLTPKTEWTVIAGEASTLQGLMKDYVAPLAGISAVCGFIGGSLVGVSLPILGTVRTPIIAGIATAIVSFVMAFVMVFVLSLIIDALAPKFGGQKNPAQAGKVAVYAFTPGWLGGILGIIPALAILGGLLALYGIYLLYLGLPRLMGNPAEKSVGYTAVVVVCVIVISFLISMVIAGLTMVTGGASMMGH